MANYDSIDLSWTWDGDYSVDEAGDIASTESDLIVSVITEVQNVMKSESFDWEKDISLGSNLSDFRGEPNSRKTGTAIERRMRSKISEIGIVQSQDINVRVVPVHANRILIMIRIAAESTPNNSLLPGEPVKVDLIYDTLERSTFFLLDDTLAKNAIL